MATLTRSYTEELAGKSRVSYEEFLDLTDSLHVEWVDGEIVELMTVAYPHTELGLFVLSTFNAFMGIHPIGRVLYEPFQLKPAPHLPGRSPDAMILLNEHLDRLMVNHIRGAADLAVEILSPGSEATDRRRKFAEYADGGIPEYWLLDPVRQRAEFYQLDARGEYRLVAPDGAGIYRSAAIPGLWLPVDWLWTRPPIQVVFAAWQQA